MVRRLGCPATSECGLDPQVGRQTAAAPPHQTCKAVSSPSRTVARLPVESPRAATASFGTPWSGRTTRSLCCPVPGRRRRGAPSLSDR
eukprot:12930040-Prorocentrum_lima.AAC.1